MPSNSLATMNGLVADAADRRVLGPDVDIHVTAIDEANTRIKPPELIERIKSAGAGGFLGLVGCSPTSILARSTSRALFERLESPS